MIEVKKVKGQNSIKPIRLNQNQYMALVNMGEDPTKFINKLVAQVAKKRRWTWWFAKQANKQ